ncbi:TPA: hypothetical protein ACHOSC_RS24980, partial [Escherichia coli]
KILISKIAHYGYNDAPGEKMTSTPSTIHSCCAVCNYSTLLVSVRLLIIWLTSHKKPLRKLLILHGVIILLTLGF